MGYRRPDGAQPPVETYSVVTEPERFQAVVDEADRLVDELERAYDVVRSPASLRGCVRAERLIPTVGTPLVVGVTGFPAVLLGFGAYGHVEVLPDCGCDACDDAPEAVVHVLQRMVGAVVRGQVVERVDRTAYEVRLTYDDGASGSSEPLSRARRVELEAMHPRGEHAWPAWLPRTT